MAKAKQRQFLKIHANKMSTSSGPEVNQPGEDRWIVINKQKVTILIPPLPVAEKSAVPNPEESQPLSRARRDNDQQSHCPIIIDSQVHPAAEFAQSMPSTAEKAIPCAPKLPLSPHIKAMPNLPRLDDKAMIEKRQVNSITRGKITGVFAASKASKQYRSFLNGDASLNPRMRALILERKLQRAGGLSCWLLSLGLDQFVNLFQGRRVGKFQLVNLTMKKLEDMGADAVGPRRKLMHAIDCLCQPYCFEVI